MNLELLFRQLRREFPKLVRFVLIGLLCLGLTTGLYALLTRIVWPSGPRTVQNALVVAFVTWINYLLNRSITFKSQDRSPQLVGRFVSVAVIALGLNNFLFWIGHEVLGVYDLLVIVIVTGIVAVFTFSSHRLFTFHHAPWRHFERFRRPR